jgi:dienelactone hydrolase
VTFARLTRGHVVALVAALALLLAMALDWYGTDAGDDARRIEQQTTPSGALAGEVDRSVKADARDIAERAEDNAWQAEPFADRLILFALLAAVALALAAAFLRAANARFKPPWTPSALATVVGLAAVLLLAGRIAQKPNTDAGAVVKLGAPLGLVCAGALTLGSRAAWRAEREAVDPAEPERPVEAATISRR